MPTQGDIENFARVISEHAKIEDGRLKEAALRGIEKGMTLFETTLKNIQGELAIDDPAPEDDFDPNESIEQIVETACASLCVLFGMKQHAKDKSQDAMNTLLAVLKIQEMVKQSV